MQNADCGIESNEFGALRRNKSSFFVIPVKTGIQPFQYVLDTRLRGYDEQAEFIKIL